MRPVFTSFPEYFFRKNVALTSYDPKKDLQTHKFNSKRKYPIHCNNLHSSTKQSIQTSENKTARKDDPMDVDALSKGKSKGKGKKGERPKPREQVLELRQDGSLVA